MELITSRKNAEITLLRTLAKDASLRLARREFLCDGRKLLQEAFHAGREVTAILWKDRPDEILQTCFSCRQMTAPAELFDYVSPLVNSPGPLFTVRMQDETEEKVPDSVMVLENVQDPGNVGTVLRTADAMGIGCVVLCGACADVYSPKAVRATMGAIFRQCVKVLSLNELADELVRWELPLYGAVLSEKAKRVQEMDLSHCAIAVGSEGSGLSRELIALCREEVIIPMCPDSESLNASVAASILMWEMKRSSR